MKKPKKYRINDLSTGKLRWVSYSTYNRTNKKRVVIIEKKEKEIKINIAKKLNILPENVKGLKLEDNITTPEQIKNFKLRNSKGQFLNKKEADKLKDYAEFLKNQNTNFTFSELRNKSEKAKKEGKKLIVTSPAQQFQYWDIQSKINTETFGPVKIIVKDFSGNIIYEGFNKAEATKQINILNKVIDAIEKKEDEEEEEVDIYPTVEVIETITKDEFLKIEINYNKLKTRLPSEIQKKIFPFIKKAKK